MEALKPMIDALIEAAGRQYEVLIYERSHRQQVQARRPAGTPESQLDVLLDERIRAVEAALADATKIKSRIYGT